MDLQMSGYHRHPVCGAARSAICDQRERTPSRRHGDSAATPGDWRSARAGGEPVRLCTAAATKCICDQVAARGVAFHQKSRAPRLGTVRFAPSLVQTVELADGRNSRTRAALPQARVQQVWPLAGEQ